ncbi:MAG: AAA family ATPase [Solirubrobacterales bacterium]
MQIDEAARREFASTKAGEGYEFPEIGETLTDDLAEPVRERKYTIDRLHPAGGNSLLVAQFKAGKTTLLLNLLRALADRQPFLGQFDVTPLDGRVAFWNYELDDDMFRDWMRDVGVENPDRVARPLHLRGRVLRLWEPAVAETVIEWLKGSEVEFLIVDPVARAWRGLVTDENDNAQVAAFTDALDTIKREAGVRDLVLSTHMGRATFDEGAERARGATRLEDWMDAGWYLSKDRDRRALHANGRDVDLEAIDLDYDEMRRHVSSTGRTRTERRLDDGVQSAIDALALAGEPMVTSKLEEAMPGTKASRNGLILQAVAAGLITRTYEDGTPVDESIKSSGKSKLCSLTEEGNRRHQRKVEPPKKKPVRKIKTTRGKRRVR